MPFEVKEGKVVFKPDNEQKTAKAGGGVTLKLEGERLAKVRSILNKSGWKNPTKPEASESTKTWKEREALVAVAIRLIDLAIEQQMTGK